MKAELRRSESADEAALEIVDIPQDHVESIEDVMRDMLAFSEQYLKCLELRLECAAGKERTNSSAVSAQILKSRAFLDQARQQLTLGISAANGEVSASDLGFPELDDGFYRGAR
ncbi:hypothetical protein [Paracoccus saliphilus]|uniref:Uncharacterized protein n=1 Tax=Paracoccus saliphilus TaxID=405559 RepID=A0AA45W561_9RHOB|nr:hypothetical protein [Paracoccus saliphilus]WCR02163.1 hypothetical protein JHX88_14795 [Paracoccus saliphilus]SIS90706.1 hypothetical protein SAMN05421772_10879 [Paracoccus saliphilus]